MTGRCGSTSAWPEATRHETGKPVRAVVVLNRQFGAEVAAELAGEYVRAGISDIELRITPLGGDDESVRKIQSVFAIAAAVTAAGLTVTLGYSGNIGQAAVALGHVAHYSVGIGMREQVNHAGTIARQKAPPRAAGADGGEDRPRGALAGIYLPGPAATVGRKPGALLLAKTDIRTRIGCRLGTCGHSVEGPTRDPRAHYLHARADEMSQLLARPARWRAATEIDRLRRAVELRTVINEHHLTDGLTPIRTRTLTSLINDIEVEQALTA